MSRDAKSDLIERAITALAASTASGGLADSVADDMDDLIQELCTRQDFLSSALALAVDYLQESEPPGSLEEATKLGARSFLVGVSTGVAAAAVSLEQRWND